MLLRSFLLCFDLERRRYDRIPSIQPGRVGPRSLLRRSVAANFPVNLYLRSRPGAKLKISTWQVVRDGFQSSRRAACGVHSEAESATLAVPITAAANVQHSSSKSCAHFISQVRSAPQSRSAAGLCRRSLCRLILSCGSWLCSLILCHRIRLRCAGC